MANADDPEFYLPTTGAARLRSLRLARDNASSASRSAFERYRRAIGEQEEAESNLTSFVNRARTMPPPRKGEEGLTEARIQQLENELHASKKKVRIEHDTYESAHAAFTAVGQTLARCEVYLEGLSKQHIAEFSPSSDQKIDFADPLAKLSKARERIVEIKSALSLVREAPRPIAEAKAAMRDYIDRQAAQASPFLSTFVFGDSRELFRITAPTAEAKQAWLFRDLIVARLDAALDQEYRSLAAPMTLKAQQKEISRLQAELLQAERHEEDIVLACLARGQMVVRRANVDPRALLSLADSCPAPNS